MICTAPKTGGKQHSWALCLQVDLTYFMVLSNQLQMNGTAWQLNLVMRVLLVR